MSFQIGIICPLDGADLRSPAVITPAGGECPWRFGSLSAGGERKGRDSEGGSVFGIYRYRAWSTQSSAVESPPGR